MRARRLTALGAVVISSALLLTACGNSGGSGNSSSSSAGGSSTGIVSDWDSEPQNPLIPTNTNEVGGGKIIDLIFSGLSYYDADGKPHNDVATSIESSDQQNWTIKIKPGLKFSDGEALTAKNFVDAWNYGANIANNQLQQYFFESIKGYVADKPNPTMSGLKVVNDTEFTVALNAPESDFPLRMGFSAYYPLPESAYKDMSAFGQKPIGNGPYTLDTWTHNQSATLRPNKSYDGPRKPKNGGVDIKFYTSLDTAYNDLLQGNLDILDQLPDSKFASYKTDLPDRNVNQPAAIFQSFTIPSKLAHFSGKEGQLRREAISYAIDRKTITQKIFEGTRTPAKDFTSPVIDGWKSDVKGNEVLSYNPTKAKELWKQADAISPWSGKFTIGYNADGGHQGWVDAVCNNLSQNLGITAEGAPYPDFKSIRDVITKRTIKGAFRSGWQADYPSMFNFLGPLYATGASSNDGDYSSATVDKLLNEGLAAKTTDEANAKFEEVQTQLFTDLPAIPLWYQNATGGWSDKVSNVKFGWNSVPLLYAVTKK